MINPEQGKRLRQILKAYNISDYRFSDIIGFDRSYISAIVNGKRSLSASVLEAIQEKFPMVEIEYLKCNPDCKYPFKSETAVNKIAETVERYASILPIFAAHGYSIKPCTDIAEYTVIDDLKWLFTFHNTPQTKYLVISPTGESKTIPFAELLSMLKMIDKFSEFVIASELFNK